MNDYCIYLGGSERAEESLKYGAINVELSISVAVQMRHDYAVGRYSNRPGIARNKPSLMRRLHALHPLWNSL